MSTMCLMLSYICTLAHANASTEIPKVSVEELDAQRTAALVATFQQSQSILGSCLSVIAAIIC